MTVALVHIPPNAGYLVLAALVGVESLGVPVPGETALIAAGVLAASGRLDIVLVIAIAAGAAIVGDNIGYAIGRRGGRSLLQMPGPLREHRRQLLERGEPLFRKHGPKAVFFGRWFSGLRIAAAWLAGLNRMEWRVFLLWNALGGIAWAITVGLAAYLLGPTAEQLFKDVGLAGVGVLVAAIAGFLVWRRLRGSSRG